MLLSKLLLGSEMSGGISNITLENILVWDSWRGVRIKTAPGRGGYIRNISCRNLTFDNLCVGIMFRNGYGEHPDNGYNPSAIPVFENILFEIPIKRGDIPVCALPCPHARHSGDPHQGGDILGHEHFIAP